MSGVQFAADKINQRAQRGKGGTINVIIVHHQAELFFQRGDQRDDCHRVQLRNGAQQGRVKGEIGRATIQTQNFVKDTAHFFGDVQFKLL